MNMVRKTGAPRPPIPEYTDEVFVGLRAPGRWPYRYVPESEWRASPSADEEVGEVVRGRYWFRRVGDEAWRGSFDTLAEARAAFIKEAQDDCG